MPLYDYCCESCGPFRHFRSIADRSQPTACRTCGTIAERTLTAPLLSLMSNNNRIAETRNEKSAHEPGVVNVLEPGGRKEPAPKVPKKLLERGGGHGHSHAHRPWMLGH
jgi:putative FmdB family regulatory protein